MKRYIMIGAPVSTVRTPPLLEAAMRAAGVAATVDTLHLEAGALASFMADVRSDPGIDGLLVTMPHKREIRVHMDSLSQAATLSGSVNAVKRLQSGRLAGEQFDGIGLLNALRSKGLAISTCRILLAGLGGAGLAIAQALAGRGCKMLALADTDSAALERARDLLCNIPYCRVAEAPSREEFDLLINATPLGMRANDASPFDTGQVTAASYIADIVADPPQTRLAAEAAAAGKTLITGREMVAGQIEPIRDWLLDP